MVRSTPRATIVPRRSAARAGTWSPYTEQSSASRGTKSPMGWWKMIRQCWCLAKVARPRTSTDWMTPAAGARMTSDGGAVGTPGPRGCTSASGPRVMRIQCSNARRPSPAT